MNKKIADLEFGKEGEIRTQKLLESLFGPLEDQNESDENSLFDFKNDHVYVEVKRRRVTKAKYPDTMVGENKVIEGFNLQLAGFRVFFAFDFVDKLCLWELNRDEYEVRHGGRYDRGRPEIKSYCYIPIEYLMDIKQDAHKIAAECPEARIHHQEAVRQVAGEDAGRDHQVESEEAQEAGQEAKEVKALEPEGPGDDTFLNHHDDEVVVVPRESDSD